MENVVLVSDFQALRKEILAELAEIKNLTLLGAKQMLTIPEAAIVLDLSESYLHSLTCAKKIPHHKPNGKKIYFDWNELIDWLSRNRIKPIYESEEEAATYIVNKKGKK